MRLPPTISSTTDSRHDNYQVNSNRQNLQLTTDNLQQTISASIKSFIGRDLWVEDLWVEDLWVEDLWVEGLWVEAQVTADNVRCRISQPRNCSLSEAYHPSGAARRVAAPTTRTVRGGRALGRLHADAGRHDSQRIR